MPGRSCSVSELLPEQVSGPDWSGRCSFKPSTSTRVILLRWAISERRTGGKVGPTCNRELVSCITSAVLLYF